MKHQTIAIVGLGRVGSVFLNELVDEAVGGIKIGYAVEKADTAGRKLAQKSGVQILSIDQLIGEGRKVDIIFDLTGSDETSLELQNKLAASGNTHTVMAPEAIARMMLALMENQKKLPEVHPNR